MQKSHIPTDGLLSGYFDVVFSVWLESQSSDTAVSSQFTFYVAESDDNSDDGDAKKWSDAIHGEDIHAFLGDMTMLGGL
jgi:hypothetical protein